MFGIGRCPFQANLMGTRFIILVVVKVLTTLSHFSPPTSLQADHGVCLRIIYSRVFHRIKKGPIVLLRSKLWYVHLKVVSLSLYHRMQCREWLRLISRNIAFQNQHDYLFCFLFLQWKCWW